jgi:hypothetical protein
MIKYVFDSAKKLFVKGYKNYWHISAMRALEDNLF